MKIKNEDTNQAENVFEELAELFAQNWRTDLLKQKVNKAYFIFFQSDGCNFFRVLC